MERARFIFIALVVLAVAQILFYYPQMPEVMASHFNGGGHPNGWQTKGAFFALTLAMIALVVGSFLVLPATFPHVTRRYMSLPHKDYWLAPERREETLRFLREGMLWHGIATMILLISVVQLVVEANLRTVVTLSNEVLWLLIAYFVFTGMWLWWFIRRFSRRPA